MELRQLAGTGLRVSALGLGTMTWGRDTDEFEARDQFEAFAEAGGNLIAAGNLDGEGQGAAVLAEALTTLARDQFVLSLRTQLTHPHPTALLLTLRQGLSDLRQEHIDIWVVDRPRPELSLGQLAATLEAAMAAGLCAHVGVTNLPGWQLAALRAELSRPERLVVGEYEYSMLVRGAERDVLPALQGLGMGMFGWSPLGRGVLTGKYRFNIPADSRAGSPHWGGFTRQLLNDRTRQVVEAVATSADGLGLSPAEVALAWLLGRPGLTSALTGARTVGQLRALLSAAEVDLPPQISAALSEVSAPAISYPDAGSNPAFR